MRHIDTIERVILILLAGGLLAAAHGGGGMIAAYYTASIAAAFAFRGFILGMNLKTFANHGYWLCGRSLWLAKQDAPEGFWMELLLAPWLAYAILFVLQGLFVPALWPFWVLGAIMSVTPIVNSVIGYNLYYRTVAQAQIEIDEENQ